MCSPVVPSRKRDRQSDEIRGANAEGLTCLLVGTQHDRCNAQPDPQRLEVCAPGGSAQADLATNDGQGVFHLRTRCANGSVGLL